MKDDLDRIMDVMAAAFAPEWGEAWTRRQVSDSLAFPHTHYRLIDVYGAIPASADPAAGFTLVRSAPGEEELLLIAVAPQWRGHGLGGALLADVVRQARTRNAERIFLEMRENNSARLLYERHGFEPIGRRPAYYRKPDGSRIDAITFGYTIAD
ncbi:GNAT family N-acetyltransferase [Tsuneonella amylolytica]|uniref:GNAT family N-acetyltransferase n=1 Tax=Tsuneonella amylolytica TaxID=2338327 RepID=UPI000EA976EF|nr:GNAT family N-acetyltransferase [Tsuneonella amylolytica]